MSRSYIGKILSLFIMAITVSACSTFGYYMELMAGHSELLEQQRPISELLADQQTKPQLRKLLQKSQNIRDFASKNLYLPENDSYRQYADIKRPYAVWNVIAAKEFSLKPKTWCFMVVGCLSYKGYFSKQDALDYAQILKQQGYDVHVAGARAYSTLGWFDDPLLNTMMYKSEARRAGIIFHELAHQKIYVDDDSAFNEAFATTIEQEGVRLWMIETKQQDQYVKFIQTKKHDTQINDLLLSTRMELKGLYKRKMIPQKMRLAKQAVFFAMQNKYKKLKSTWKGKNINAFDAWMAQDFNNAHLSLIATYHHLVPKFQVILEKENNDLEKFYIKTEELTKLDKTLRDNKWK